jgi:hypothetical protein
MADDAPPFGTSFAERPLSRAVIVTVLVASFMVASFAISSQSYWIEEAFSLIVATAGSPAEAWKYMHAVSGSTLQMPFYQAYLYGWHKVFGGGEWAMRASNLPWFLFGQLAFLVLLRHRPRLALIACLLAAVSPILWMYLDETRPYVMQYAGACWLAAAIVRLTSEEPSPSTTYAWLLIAALGASIVVLFASSLIGVIWAAAYMLALFFVLRGRADSEAASMSRNVWLVLLFTLALLVGFTAYYVFTWSDAGRGYHHSGPSLLSLPFIAYELLGFSGFGPGKIAMRAEPIASVMRSIPALAPLAVILGLLGVYAARLCVKRANCPRKAIVVWALALGLPLVAIFGAMFLFDHRPLPRHFIPALPAVLLAIAALVQSALQARPLFWRSVAVALPVLWLLSSLSFRWQPVHAKDNYREASAIAAAGLRENKEVWWAADPAAAYIYFTPIALEKVPGRAWAMQAPSWNDIRFKFPPRVIVISKPDIYDPQGAVARYAAENRFVVARQLQAFTIFTREGDDLPAANP